MHKKTIRTFQDLETWQEAHKLLLAVYRFSCQFPKEEQFLLTNQIRRASLSVTSNIAEGFGRLSQPDRLRFYSMAVASLTEVQNQLLASRDLGYLPQSLFDAVWAQSESVGRLLGGLIRSGRQTP